MDQDHEDLLVDESPFPQFIATSDLSRPYAISCPWLPVFRKINHGGAQLHSLSSSCSIYALAEPSGIRHSLIFLHYTATLTLPTNFSSVLFFNLILNLLLIRYYLLTIPRMHFPSPFCSQSMFAFAHQSAATCKVLNPDFFNSKLQLSWLKLCFSSLKCFCVYHSRQ